MADVEGGGSNHTQVLIHIEDQNDNAPKFSSSLVEIVVREDQPSGEAFYVVHAIDKDRKKNGRVRYSLLSSHPPSPVVVDGVTGQLILKGAFDHESVRDFKIRVKAQDEGIPPKSSNITVVLHISDVNDNAPIFERHEYRAEVVENSAAKIEVAKIVARDADSQENGQVLYRVTNGSEYFGIDEKLGTLYTKRSFDREIIDHVDVTVVAEDRGMPSHSTTTHVRVDVLDVNDNSPSCQSISALVILSTAGPSSVVGTIVAVDPDKGLNGSVVYRSQIQHSLFIVKANGDVQLRRPLKESDASDFRLSVIASDQGVPRKSSVCHVAIKVSKGESDVILTEPFARSISLPENCSSYCRIESFHATGVAKWQLQSSELSNHFVIREGVLSLMSVPSHRPPYTLTLILSDSQGRQKHVPIRIHALSAKNQQPPIRLQDSMAIGARIGSVGESSSTGEYFYKPLNSSNCPFALDESSGALYLAEKIREPEVFTCLFQRYNTTDGVAEEFSVDFETTSNQLDKPVFENWTVRTTVRENVSPGSVIATMNASASDSTTVNYRFREESLQFSIDQFTGAVSLVESLHWHEASVHLLVVEAFVGARSTSSVLIVEVEDINDCAPQFLSCRVQLPVQAEMDQGRIRTFVYYELLLGNDTGTAIANICRACKEDTVSQRTVRRWFNRFESGDTSRPAPAEDHALLLEVTASIYTDQFEKLAAAIREKRPRRASVHFQHDNARPHVAKETQQKLATLGWETVSHPPYSSDLAPSDYHLFRPLEHRSAGRKFTNYDNLKSDFADLFESQPPEFWGKGIGDLPNRWTTVVNTCGDCIVD
ncbi:unnamed protein product [Caenorhabditis auriculariae]|uniref:Cadherin domain-containing protein n=1 Tax=Caenorhabditis auriculariae TaxID=2777116 RepID=A0A8S1GXJ9_9PELO|nr:unnamed protein product [Caenorhabditis auriculariae]